MKKYLSIICVLVMLTVFASCGNSTSSSDSSEVPESSVLDSVFENDYLKISVNDDWKEHTDTLIDTHHIYWSWKDESSSEHTITLDITEDYSGKMSLGDFNSIYHRRKYDKNLGYLYEKKIINSFEINNQAYIITENNKTYNVFFKTNEIFGEFTYSDNDEEVIMDMIDSIEFKTIETTTETTTKRRIKKNTYTTKSKENTEKVTQPVTEPPTEKPVETQPPVIETSPVQTTLHFILNLETNCIHIDPRCSAAQKILPENYSEIDIAETDLSSYRDFYWACGKCSKEYKQILPKIE